MASPPFSGTPLASPRQAALELLRPGSGDGKPLWMEVRGRSMLPTLRPDDRVEVEGVDPSRLRLGDIVVIDSGESGWVIHRFFGWRHAPPAPLTKGDARRFFDPIWPGCRILGRVSGFERSGKRRYFGRTRLLAGAIRSAIQWCWGKALRSLGLEGAP